MTTFQSPMSEFLCLFLCHPVLVFLDNILKYNMSLSKHLGHIRVLFSTLCEQHSSYGVKARHGDGGCLDA